MLSFTFDLLLYYVDMLNVIKLSIGVPGQSYSRIRGVWKGLQGRNPRGQFLEQKHMISPSFRWDQIIKCRRYEIGDNILSLKTDPPLWPVL